MKVEFTVERDDETGVFVASWDDPRGGGITTQARNLAELSDAIMEAVRCHFSDGVAPKSCDPSFSEGPRIAACVKLPRDLSAQGR